MEEQKKKGRFVRPLIVAACAAVVGLSVYADWNYGNSVKEEAGYIYNSSATGEKAKILGEATFVGNLGADAEPVSGGDQKDISEESYFTLASLDRQRARDESLELLQEVVDSSETMPDAKNHALYDITQIASAIESETNIETLIKAKGFDDCLAVISGDNVNVIVKTTGLLTYEVAQIREIVMEELDIPADNIKIIEKIN